jgi:hypothetical protein
MDYNAPSNYPIKSNAGIMQVLESIPCDPCHSRAAAYGDRIIVVPLDLSNSTSQIDGRMNVDAGRSRRLGAARACVQEAS